MASGNVNIPYSYLLVIDFEATCCKGRIPIDQKRKNSEIINFPCVLYDVKEKKILEEFQKYVKPTQHPILTSFCKELTGIIQTDVTNGVLLESCLQMFVDWVNSLREKYHFTMVDADEECKRCMIATWSDWDIGLYLVSECKRKGLNVPSILANWIDLRSLFRRHYYNRAGLEEAMRKLGLVFEGKPHCGLDDAKNTARLAGKMIDNGIILKVTSKLEADNTYLFFV